jgi:hypothetical protein
MHGYARTPAVLLSGGQQRLRIAQELAGRPQFCAILAFGWAPRAPRATAASGSMEAERQRPLPGGHDGYRHQADRDQGERLAAPPGYAPERRSAGTTGQAGSFGTGGPEAPPGSRADRGRPGW